MLPSYGIVYGAFVLAYAARLSPRQDVETWIRAARDQSSFLATATNLEAPAWILQDLRLVRAEDEISITPRLEPLSLLADRETFVGIARMLLEAYPPVWLWSAVGKGQVAREYIPTGDLDALEWLEPDLDAILLDVYARLLPAKQTALIKQIGDAAEEFLMAAFTLAGRDPVHVARFYDGCGYDIELPSQPLDRIEVKAASTATKGRFRLTRNEYEKCRLHGPEWRLVQVVFAQAAFFAERVTASHIVEIIETTAERVLDCVPADTSSFKWVESAEIGLEPEAWSLVTLPLHPHFSVSGFRSQAVGLLAVA